MCLRNLFGGNDCTWILFIIIVLLPFDDELYGSFGRIVAYAG